MSASMAPSRGLVRSAMAAWGIALLLAIALALAWHRGGAGSVREGDVAGSGDRRGPAPILSRESLPIERVDRISIKAGGGPLVFERGDEGWRQVQPFIQAADGAQLRELLVRVSEVRASRAVNASVADMAALGLEPPQAEVTIAWGAESRRIRLGRRGVGGRAWLRVDDGPPLAADPAAHEAILDSDPRRWRSWRLFDRVGASTDRLVVHRTPADGRREPQTLELERKEGRWSMLAPWRTRVDASAIDGVLSALSRAEHSGFLDDAPEDLALYGLERPIASVEAWSIERRARDGSVEQQRVSERIEIGSGLVQGGSLSARRIDRPPVVLLDQAALAALLPAPVALVDPRPCGHAPADIRTVRVRDREGRLRFQLDRSLEGWTLREASGAGEQGIDGALAPTEAELEVAGPASPTAVQQLLERLTAARAPELALQPMPEALRVATIEVVPTLGPSSIIRVARESEQGKWALDESDDVLRVFPPSFDLPLEAALYRGARAAPPARRDVE